MDRKKLNLDHLLSRRDRELLDRTGDTEFDRILSGKVNFISTPLDQKFVGDRAPLAQDAFRSILLSQGRVHKDL